MSNMVFYVKSTGTAISGRRSEEGGRGGVKLVVSAKIQ